MLNWLKLVWKKQSATLSGDLPETTEKLNECYAGVDLANRWQGDVYSRNDFVTGAIPSDKVPFFMLANRTCQLYVGQGRDVKLQHLNFIAVRPIDEFLKNTEQKKIVVAQLKEVIKQNESLAFLPECPGLGTPHVVLFNYVITIPLISCPKPEKKILQLSSPFSEFVFQRFSRFFYTVGFDDERIKSNDYIEKLADAILTRNQ